MSKIKWFGPVVAVVLLALAMGGPALGVKGGKGKPGGGGGGETPSFSVLQLGALGGDTSRASAINELGEIVGEADNSLGIGRAFIWDPDNGMLELPGGFESRANDLNHLGEVVGAASEQAGGRLHAALWKSDTFGNFSMVSLAAVGEYESRAFGINSHGQIVGARRYLVADGDEVWDAWHSFLWEDLNDDGDFQDAGEEINLGAPQAGLTTIIAFDINDSGQVVGIANNSGISVFEHFDLSYVITPLDTDNDNTPDTWFVDAGDGITNLLMTELGTLGGRDGEARGINEDGVIAGLARTSRGKLHGVTWELIDGQWEIKDLGNLKGKEHTWGYALNNPDAQGNVQVVGDGGKWFRQGVASVPDYDAFLWTSQQMFNLNSLVVDFDGFSKLTRAFGINDRGLVIGEGTYNGKPRAFVAVPTPTSN